MKSKINKLIIHTASYLKIIDELNSDMLILFITDNKKIACESFYQYKYRKMAREIANQIAITLEDILKIKIHISMYKIDGLYRFLISKEYIKNDILPEEISVLFGIPFCCIKKYKKEDLGSGSFISALRYFGQCRELGESNKFKVEITDDMGVHCGYGFVPCHPKCKHANIRLNKINKINNYLEDKDGK